MLGCVCMSITAKHLCDMSIFGIDAGLPFAVLLGVSAGTLCCLANATTGSLVFNATKSVMSQMHKEGLYKHGSCRAVAHWKLTESAIAFPVFKP